MKYVSLLMLLGMLLVGQSFADSIFFLNNPQYFYTNNSGGVMVGENQSSIGRGGFKFDFFQVSGGSGILQTEAYIPGKYELLMNGNLSNVVFHSNTNTISGLFTGWDNVYNYNTHSWNDTFISNGAFSERWNNGNLTVRTKGTGQSTAAEPGALVLMITGLASLAAIGRKKIAASA